MIGHDRSSRGERRLRVALFTDTYAPQINGVTRTLARLATALEERGHATRVYTCADPRAESDPIVLRWPSVAFWAYPELRLAAPSRPAITNSLRAWSPNLVHLATPFGVGLAGGSVARKLGIPVVSSYHTSLSEYARFYGLGALSAPGWWYLRNFHNGTRRTYVPTRAVSNELAGRGFTRLTLWPRGVDTVAFNPEWRSDELRRSWGADPHTVVVAYVGRVAKEKGIDVALDAANLLGERLGENRRRVKFVAVGDGPYENAARARAPRDTRFLGRLSGNALYTAYASSDILLFPSTTDTFGNVLLEAMASRLAVIAAAVPQTREVCDGQAVLFEPGSATSLADHLHRLVLDGGARERLRESALVHARTRGWKVVFDDLLADYQTIVNSAGVESAGHLLHQPFELRQRRASA